jgi:hypothetical protein
MDKNLKTKEEKALELYEKQMIQKAQLDEQLKKEKCEIIYVDFVNKKRIKK